MQKNKPKLKLHFAVQVSFLPPVKHEPASVRRKREDSRSLAAMQTFRLLKTFSAAGLEQFVL